MGMTGYPKLSVRNNYFKLHSIPEESRSHITIWGCRPWFGSAWSSSEWSSLVQSSSALCTRIEDDLTYLSTKFKEKHYPALQ